MRVGFLSVKHLRADTQRRIVEKRRVKPYKNIGDFYERVQPDDDEAHALIHAGAFDVLYPKEKRAALLWELAICRKDRSNRVKEPELFCMEQNIVRPEFPDENSCQRLRYEFDVLGFLCSQHPMSIYADAVKKMNVVKAKKLPECVGQFVRIAGLLITGKIVHTRHGDPMEFLTFEDETGLVETTFFPKAYRRFCAILDRSRPFILYGKVEEDFGAVTLNVEKVTPVSRTLV